jgi:hypothetical protein
VRDVITGIRRKRRRLRTDRWLNARFRLGTLNDDAHVAYKRCDGCDRRNRWREKNCCRSATNANGQREFHQRAAVLADAHTAGVTLFDYVLELVDELIAFDLDLFEVDSWDVFRAHSHGWLSDGALMVQVSRCFLRLATVR